MASASLGRGGAGSSRTGNGFKGPSSSVDWLGTEMLAMSLTDKVDHDDDRVNFWILLLTQKSIHLCLVVNEPRDNSFRYLLH